MADCKKYDGSTWLHSLRKLTTATDTLTTLPADLYADGNNATVGLKGNMSQTGTPTPTTPIQPSECGDLETTGEHAGQYKIPILSAGQTNNIYLGEVQTTRRVKKLVLDGTESLHEGVSNYYIFINVSGREEGIPNSTALSTHTESGVLVNNNGTALFFKKSVFVHSSLTDFKTYLQQQYENGTPVTVWYVLSSATTGIVNEPLRKIGDYADTVSGISIPTTTGKDTFDVETTLKPSEVSLSYTGWHDATVKEWDGSDWQ